MSKSTLSSHEANAQGLVALNVGDSATAVRLFTHAVSVDPQAGSLWRNLAHAHRLLGDDDGERRALQGALETDQRDVAALVRLAELHERRGETRDALLRWSAVLQLGEQIADPAPAFVQILDHARAYCQAQQAALDETARRRSTAFLDHALGRRRVYRNQCAGLHYPFLPADEYFDDHHFPWFDDLAARAPAIRAELEALLADPGDALRPYVRMDKGASGSQWDQLDHNADWSACFLWEYGQPNQPVLDRCPETAAALAATPSAHIPGRAPSAFFSMLRPHTRIPPHTGVTNTRAIIHLPLIVPPRCGFRVGGETREWVEGRPFAFDDTIEHEAWNESNSLRAILIFDVWNPHLSPEEQAVIADYCRTADALTEPAAR
jgi:aspartyl/asparaginyl beta-hydroxylase (cupin superfamily)